VEPIDRRHLTDQRLIDTYFARVGDGSQLDAVQAECEHVQACEACARRYEDLTASLERLRETAFDEADAYFTADRLAAQRNHILRHLEGIEHPARVIPFPHATAKPRVARVHTPLFRWVAAAAAAGLMIGVSAGRMYYLKSGASPRAAASLQARTAQPAFGVSDPSYDSAAPDSNVDEALLSEIENAMVQQRIAALQALDAMTPRVQDAVARVK
jgi:hypothetical protein